MKERRKEEKKGKGDLQISASNSRNWNSNTTFQHHVSQKTGKENEGGIGQC